MEITIKNTTDGNFEHNLSVVFYPEDHAQIPRNVDIVLEAFLKAKNDAALGMSPCLVESMSVTFRKGVPLPK